MVLKAKIFIGRAYSLYPLFILTWDSASFAPGWYRTRPWRSEFRFQHPPERDGAEESGMTCARNSDGLLRSRRRSYLVGGQSLQKSGITHTRQSATLSDLFYDGAHRSIQMEEAQAQKAPSQRFVDIFARYYTPAVTGWPYSSFWSRLCFLMARGESGSIERWSCW